MEDLTPDDWEELMSVDENHGRTRSEGSWHALDNIAAMSIEEHLEYMVYVPIHGVRSTYVNEGCRCKACKRAEAEYRRTLRSSGTVPEANQKEG